VTGDAFIRALDTRHVRDGLAGAYKTTEDEREEIQRRNVTRLLGARMPVREIAELLRIKPVAVARLAQVCLECGAAAARKGRVFCSRSCATAATNRHAKKGATHTAATKAKISAASRHAWERDADRHRRHGERIAEWNRSRRGVKRGPKSPEARARIAAGQRRAWARRREAAS
jgi:hypothetical protein